MARKRIRCVCGTVFDPAKLAVCPACGSAPVAHGVREQAPALDSPAPSSMAPGTATTSASPSRDAPTFVQQHRAVLTAAAGIAALLVLALVVRVLFSGSNTPAPTAQGHANAATDPHPDTSHPNATIPAAQGTGTTPAPPTSAAPQPGLAGFVGSWRLLTARMQPEPIVPGIPSVSVVLNHSVTAAFLGPDTNVTLTIDRNGTYVIDIDIVGEGQYAATVNPERYPGNVKAQGVMTFTPKGTAMPDRARAILYEVTQNMPHVGAHASDTQLALMGAGGNMAQPAIWYRAGGSGQLHTEIIGAWTNQQVFIDSFLPYHATLDIKENGDYRLRFTRTERGMLEINDGRYEFKRAIAMGPPIQGRYEFNGANHVTFTEPRGSAQWVRLQPAAATPTPRVRR